MMTWRWKRFAQDNRWPFLRDRHPLRWRLTLQCGEAARYAAKGQHRSRALVLSWPCSRVREIEEGAHRHPYHVELCVALTVLIAVLRPRVVTPREPGSGELRTWTVPSRAANFSRASSMRCLYRPDIEIQGCPSRGTGLALPAVPAPKARVYKRHAPKAASFPPERSS